MEFVFLTNIPLGPILAKLGIVLMASLMVERFLVLLNSLLNRFMAFQIIWSPKPKSETASRTAFAERAAREAEILLAEDDVEEPLSASDITPHPDTDPKTDNPDSLFDLKKILKPEDADNADVRFKLKLKQNQIRKEFWMQVFGIFIAVWCCVKAKFSMWIFVEFADDSTKLANGIENVDSTLWGFIFTGIIIGAGSKPINFLMNFLMNRKIEAVRKEVETVKSEAQPLANFESPTKKIPAQERSIEEIIGFTYNGGDRPKRLENTHKFPRGAKSIEMIVYHHTAMNSESPFEEVVREFDRKGWLTGYNCVVMKDGTIHALCRWDRYGNHAKGHNSKSLGIALHGNFEPNPRTPYSNPDGKYGIMRPTSMQVDSTAKIVALWALMHDIEIKFPKKKAKKGILPHYLLKNKACPGGNFPHEAFREKVKDYASKWKKDKEFQKALERFMAQPYVSPQNA